MQYRFRLTFRHSSRGFFQIEQESVAFRLECGPELSVVARDAKQLSQAMHFHCEAGGYPNIESAQAAGEHLRLRVHILNAALGLRMFVPTSDSISGRTSDEVKAKVLDETNMVVLDSIDGLSVFPDDGRHLEFVVAPKYEAYPNDPEYLFKQLSKLWGHDMTLNEQAQDALEILSRSTTEVSSRNQFLLTYLACERMVERGSRSHKALLLIEEFRARVADSGLDPREAESLKGALGHLKDTSFSSALMELVARIQSPPEVAGQPLRKFLSSCITTRNRIAHNAAPPANELRVLSEGLRQFVLGLIWTANGIPRVDLNQPTSTVRIPEGGFTIRVK